MWANWWIDVGNLYFNLFSDNIKLEWPKIYVCAESDVCYRMQYPVCIVLILNIWWWQKCIWKSMNIHNFLIIELLSFRAYWLTNFLADYCVCMIWMILDELFELFIDPDIVKCTPWCRIHRHLTWCSDNTICKIKNGFSLKTSFLSGLSEVH